MSSRQAVRVRREEILRAAVEQITLLGFANTRVADVANTLNVSTALVFYHFESKDRLLSEAFSYAAERDLEQLATISSSGASALDRLSRILALYSPSASSRPAGQTWRLWIDAWATALREPDLQAVSHKLDQIWIETIEHVITDGVAAAEFTCADPTASAWRVAALIDGLAVQATVHKDVSRPTMLRWVREMAASELGVAADLIAMS